MHYLGTCVRDVFCISGSILVKWGPSGIFIKTVKISNKSGNSSNRQQQQVLYASQEIVIFGLILVMSWRGGSWDAAKGVTLGGVATAGNKAS